jgi:hypothetical protein
MIHRSEKRRIMAAAVVFVAAGLLVAAAPRLRATRPTAEGVERGRYLVHHVAMCVQCHSPRDERGELQRLHLLEGGRIPVSSPYPDETWAFEAPHLAGLPGFDPDAVVTLLMTGHLPDGRSPRPPMPPFRLSREDAEAVVAYLRSLD